MGLSSVNFTGEVWEACRKFKLVTDMKVAAKIRANEIIMYESKVEPLKNKGCTRNKVFFEGAPLVNGERKPHSKLINL